MAKSSPGYSPYTPPPNYTPNVVPVAVTPSEAARGYGGSNAIVVGNNGNVISNPSNVGIGSGIGNGGWGGGGSWNPADRGSPSQEPTFSGTEQLSTPIAQTKQTPAQQTPAQQTPTQQPKAYGQTGEWYYENGVWKNTAGFNQPGTMGNTFFENRINVPVTGSPTGFNQKITKPVITSPTNKIATPGALIPVFSDGVLSGWKNQQGVVQKAPPEQNESAVRTFKPDYLYGALSVSDTAAARAKEGSLAKAGYTAKSQGIGVAIGLRDFFGGLVGSNKEGISEAAKASQNQQGFLGSVIPGGGQPSIPKTYSGWGENIGNKLRSSSGAGQILGANLPGIIVGGAFAAGAARSVSAAAVKVAKPIRFVTRAETSTIGTPSGRLLSSTEVYTGAEFNLKNPVKNTFLGRLNIAGKATTRLLPDMPIKEGTQYKGGFTAGRITNPSAALQGEMPKFSGKLVAGKVSAFGFDIAPPIKATNEMFGGVIGKTTPTKYFRISRWTGAAKKTFGFLPPASDVAAVYKFTKTAQITAPTGVSKSIFQKIGVGTSNPATGKAQSSAISGTEHFTLVPEEMFPGKSGFTRKLNLKPSASEIRSGGNTAQTFQIVETKAATKTAANELAGRATETFARENIVQRQANWLKGIEASAARVTTKAVAGSFLSGAFAKQASRSTTRTRTMQMPSFANSIRQIFKPSTTQIPGTDTTIREGQLTRTTPRITTSTGTTTTPPPFVMPPIIPTGGFPIILPTPSRLNFGGLGSKEVSASRKYAYTPSFAALSFRITGKQPKKQVFSGFEVRPITKGFSWARLQYNK